MHFLRFYSKGVPSKTNKYLLRPNFNVNEILMSSIDYKSFLVELNKNGMKDEYLISNALILREYSSLPSTSHWPLVYDPDGFSIKTLTMMQESINTIKSSLNNEYLNSSPLMSGLLKNAESFHGVQGDEMESTLAEHASANPTLALFQTNDQTSSNDMNYNKVESIMSASSSRLSAYNHKSIISRMSGRASSIWETSTFYSQARSQTAATFYQSKSGKNFLVSLESSNEISEVFAQS